MAAAARLPRSPAATSASGIRRSTPRRWPRLRRLGGLRRRKEKAVSGAYDFEGLGQHPPDQDGYSKMAVLDTLSLENSIARNRTIAYLAQVSVNLLDKGEMESRARSPGRYSPEERLESL